MIEKRDSMLGLAELLRSFSKSALEHQTEDVAAATINESQ
jgi:hypothetical protein